MLPTSHAPPNNPSTPPSPSKIRTYVHTPTEAKVVLPFELSPSNSNYSLFNTNGEILLGDAPPSRTRRPWFTYVVSAIQVVTLFIPLCTCQIAPIMINPMLGPYPTILDDWGAKNTWKMVVLSQWSRLYTPIFLHSGILHLAGNLMIQLDACQRYEREWGLPIYAGIYLGSGIGGCLFSALVKPGKLGVGGSGAIMGVLGARIGEGLVKYYDVGGGIDDLETNIVSLAFVLLMSFVPFVDWPAHVGGAVVGFVMGSIRFANSTLFGRYGCKAFSTVAGIFLFLAVDFMFGALFFVDLGPYEYLADTCQYLKDAFENTGQR
ncbi:hypothetical protein TrRE_jg7462 [Triparma retinervis]|uniref:rhomboid protease n=1 Tax=Triparma retinervis TaxID=2557542 RepID=A0A9W7G079_9STRA|nr:hypothetical protein TrRE_jg7462 [Triparma retinervis]